MCSANKNIAAIITLIFSMVTIFSSCSPAGLIVPDENLIPDIVQVEKPLEAMEAKTVENHLLIAQNNTYSLYVNHEAMSILIENNQTGQIMHSAVAEPDENDNLMWRNFIKSGISIEYYAGTSTTALRADMFLKKPKKTVEPIRDGFIAHIEYTELGIQLDVMAKLTDSGLQVVIPAESVKETAANKLSAVYAFPFLGYTFRGEEEGYMLIPDGCGALIDLKDNFEKFQQPFKAPVYGYDYGIVEETTGAFTPYKEAIELNQTQTVLAPVFGMVHSKKQMGFIGIIESGQYNAEIEAYPNGAVTQYNWITAKFIYRNQYILPASKKTGFPAVEEDIQRFDIVVNYLLVNGGEANYAGLAKAYRQYLLSHGRLPAHQGQKAIRLDFLGGDAEKAMVGNKFIPMTTAEQVAEILNTLSAEEKGSILATYNAWQPRGRFGILSEAKLDIRLGSIEQLSVTDKQTDLALGGDFLRNYTGTKEAQTVFRLNEKQLISTSGLPLHKTVTYMTPQAISETVAKTSDSLTKKGITKMLVDGASKHLVSFRQGEKMISRTQSASILQNSMKTAHEKIRLSLSAPFSYLWKYSDDFLDFQLYGSNYKFSSKEIPFFAIVLQGSMALYGEYANYQPNQKEYFLKLAESGIAPGFLMTYSETSGLLYTDSKNLYAAYYKNSLGMINEYYNQFATLFQKTDGSEIVDHESNDGVSKTVYANGVSVYVNFNDTEKTADNGLMLKPLSFQVTG